MSSISSPGTSVGAANTTEASCADVLYRLWNSCRNNYTPAHRPSESPVSLHPCDGVFASLCLDCVVVETCGEALFDYRETMERSGIASCYTSYNVSHIQTNSLTPTYCLLLLSNSIDNCNTEVAYL